ncbi:hypothetical protein BURKHO8Y_170264 [Burkholderia sp. 8Y]|nr:hypothetical protein BURKHO8Y_170264 [Burkholderia sp. 8Y]
MSATTRAAASDVAKTAPILLIRATAANGRALADRVAPPLIEYEMDCRDGPNHARARFSGCFDFTLTPQIVTDRFGVI